GGGGVWEWRWGVAARSWELFPGLMASALTGIVGLATVSEPSPTDVQFAPLFVDLKTPPATPPAYHVVPALSVTSARTRPPRFVGPSGPQVPTFGSDGAADRALTPPPGR